MPVGNQNTKCLVVTETGVKSLKLKCIERARSLRGQCIKIPKISLQSPLQMEKMGVEARLSVNPELSPALLSGDQPHF